MISLKSLTKWSSFGLNPFIISVSCLVLTRITNRGHCRQKEQWEVMADWLPSLCKLSGLLSVTTLRLGLATSLIWLADNYFRNCDVMIAKNVTWRLWHHKLIVIGMTQFPDRTCLLNELNRDGFSQNARDTSGCPLGFCEVTIFMIFISTNLITWLATQTLSGNTLRSPDRIIQIHPGWSILIK